MTDRSLTDIFAPSPELPAVHPIRFDPNRPAVSPAERRYALALQSILSGSSDPYALAVAAQALSGRTTADLKDASQESAYAASSIEARLLRSLLAVIAASRAVDTALIPEFETAIHEFCRLIRELGIDPDANPANER